MDNVKFWQAFRLAFLLFISNCGAQQNSIFNQNQYRRPLQIQQQQNQFNRLQTPFATPLPSLLGQQNYQNYNQFNPRNVVPITSYVNEINYDGSFQYGYSTGDGTTAQAQGYIKNAGVKDLEAQVVQGSYSYTSPEGTPIRVTYIADENGFRAEGAHLPTSPPIPDAIAKSLNYIARLQPNQPYNPNINPNLNPNLNPYQTPFQQSPNRLNQFNPLQLQQQNPNYQQQQRQLGGGQFQPQNPFNQQQRPFGQQFPQRTPLQQQQEQQQQQQQQQNIQQQQQNGIQQQQQQNIQQQQQLQQQNPQQQQQLLTQQLQGRPNQLIPNQFGYNKFRRYKKNAKESS